MRLGQWLPGDEERELILAWLIESEFFLDSQIMGLRVVDPDLCGEDVDDILAAVPLRLDQE